MIFYIIIYYVIAILFCIYTIRRNFITPGLLFVGMQLVMFSGILTYVDLSISSDRKLVYIYLIALIMFIIGDISAKRIFPENINYTVVDDDFELSQYRTLAILAMVAVSVLACLYFFATSGYNVFMMILSTISSGSAGNYTDARISLNNVSGVGYIYQFRVIILPLLTAFLVTGTNSKWLRRIGIITFPFMIAFVLGTGQRGGFVMFILMWMVSLLYIYKFYREETIKRIMVVVAGFAVILFFIMTIFNGRVAEDGTVLQAVLARVFDDNQQCAVIAFRYIDSQPIQWGRDWWLSLKDILPGKNDYLQLSYVVFDIMYGSTRGTAPPCIWGSAYYNWGFVGIVLMPFIMGILYRKLYASFASWPINKLTIFICSAQFVVLGYWMADTPLVLFNQGFVTLCLMRFILRINSKIAISVGEYYIE